MIAHPALTGTVLDYLVQQMGIDARFNADGEGFGGGEENGAAEVVVAYFGGETGA